MFFVSLYINISNILTCFRLFSSIPVSWLIFHEHFLWTLSLIFLAGISDTFDGFLARRFDQCTVLGSYLDPVADKVLIFCVYVALAMKGALPVWLMFLVIGRDVLIVSVFLFSLAMKWNLNFNPLWIGKVSTFF
ncbi:MAG: CDP-alcohol phosphatidyltransferase family protein, partial [Alphaproteobacteria bacterium]|nr:CDP-alcohol phosphatidyltransferase family protein [Alphaproteobacteria bacterium]